MSDNSVIFFYFIFTFSTNSSAKLYNVKCSDDTRRKGINIFWRCQVFARENGDHYRDVVPSALVAIFRAPLVSVMRAYSHRRRTVRLIAFQWLFLKSDISAFNGGRDTIIKWYLLFNHYDCYPLGWLAFIIVGQTISCKNVVCLVIETILSAVHHGDNRYCISMALPATIFNRSGRYWHSINFCGNMAWQKTRAHQAVCERDDVTTLNHPYNSLWHAMQFDCPSDCRLKVNATAR